MCALLEGQDFFLHLVLDCSSDRAELWPVASVWVLPPLWLFQAASHRISISKYKRAYYWEKKKNYVVLHKKEEIDWGYLKGSR